MSVDGAKAAVDASPVMKQDIVKEKPIINLISDAKCGRRNQFSPLAYAMTMMDEEITSNQTMLIFLFLRCCVSQSQSVSVSVNNFTSDQVTKEKISRTYKIPNQNDFLHYSSK